MSVRNFGQQTLASVGTENRPQESPQVGYDLVHADCKFIFGKAERDRRQTMVQLEKASGAARKFKTEKVRSNAQLRKQISELNESRKRNVELEQRLKESTVDYQIYVLREEHKRILEELGKVSSYMSRTIELKRKGPKAFTERCHAYFRCFSKLLATGRAFQTAPQPCRYR